MVFIDATARADNNEDVPNAQPKGDAYVCTFQHERTNYNGAYVVELCKETRLSAVNTFFHARPTYYSGDGSDPSHIDYILLHVSMREHADKVEIWQRAGDRLHHPRRSAHLARGNCHTV